MFGEQFSWMEVSALTWAGSFQGLQSVWVTPPVTSTGHIRQPPWAKRSWKTTLLRYSPCKKQKMIKSYPLPGVWSGGGVEMCRSLEIWENPCSTGFHLEEMENPGGSFCAHYTFVAQNSLWPHRDKNPCWNLHLHPAKIAFLIATGALGEFLALGGSRRVKGTISSWFALEEQRPLQSTLGHETQEEQWTLG